MFKRAFLTLLSLSFLISTQAMANDKMTVLLDWFVNPDHGPLIIAQEKGYFADAGLEVEIVAPADPSAPPKLVAAGQADIAISYQPQLHLQIAEGLPLVRVGTLVATPLNCLLVLEEGPVKSLADLKGEGIPSYDELIYVANPANMDADEMARFIGATELATQFIINNPRESWKIFSGTAKELQNELNERAWADTLPRFALRPAAFDAGRYQRFQSFLIESGLLSEAMPIDKIAIDVTAK